MGMAFILSAGADVCGASQLCVGGIGFSPSGEKGEGFVRFALQSRHANQEYRHRSKSH